MNHTLHLTRNLIMLAGVFMQIGHQYYTGIFGITPIVILRSFVNFIIIQSAFFHTAPYADDHDKRVRHKHVLRARKMSLQKEIFKGGFFLFW